MVTSHIASPGTYSEIQRIQFSPVYFLKRNNKDIITRTHLLLFLLTGMSSDPSRLPPTGRGRRGPSPQGATASNYETPSTGPLQLLFTIRYSVCNSPLCHRPCLHGAKKLYSKSRAKLHPLWLCSVRGFGVITEQVFLGKWRERR